MYLSHLFGINWNCFLPVVLNFSEELAEQKIIADILENIHNESSFFFMS